MTTRATSTLEKMFLKGTPESILKHIQSHKILAPSVVLKIAVPLLKTKLSASQRLTILEQVTISALHDQQITLAESTLTEICGITGKNSQRYRKLLALCLESQANYEKALEIYDAMLEDNNSNIYALKRKYCILRAEINDIEARKCLNDYLERNASDAAGWEEMAKTCMENGDYQGASFCYEEVILFSPTDSSIHCTLGELYVSVGGKENYTLARKHFAQCLEFDGSCVRAMYGLISASEHFLDVAGGGNVSKKSKGYVDEEETEMVKDLKRHAISLLRESYQGSGLSAALLESILAL